MQKDEWPICLTATTQVGHGEIAMSEIADKGKDVGEKAKALADAGIEKLKGVDWKAQGDKAKALADAGMAKLKDVDWKAQSASAREKANAAKDKIVATWRSGNKGKAICIVGALLLVWIGSCIFGGGGEGSDGFTLRGDDLKSEAKTDKLFYVRNGKDDGFAKVVPNLKKIPTWVHGGTLAHCLNPHLEADLRIRGKAYLNDPENRWGSWCVVNHVADGHVIVRPDDPSWSGDYYGYIETDDDYVEGANLRRGLYAFVGKKTVPLANGSSMTMYAFASIDREISDKVIAALEYNFEAKEEAEKENGRRSSAKSKEEKTRKFEAVYKALSEEFKGFAIPDVNKQVHVPKGFEKFGVKFEIEQDRIVVMSGQWFSSEDLMSEIKNGDWEALMRRTQYDESENVESIVKWISDNYWLGIRKVASKGMIDFDLRSQYAFVIVNNLDTKNKACENAETTSQGRSVIVSVRLCEDLYVVDKKDTELLSLMADKEKFVKAYKAKN